MKLSVAEFADAIGAMNTCLENKQDKLELLEKAICAFVEEGALQGKSYQSAKNYFKEIHLPVVRGMILAYQEIRSANTRCLSDLYSQVSSDYTMKIDTEGLAYYIEEAKKTLNQLNDLEQESPFVQLQRNHLQNLENEINKVIYFNQSHVSHYDTANSYMNDVRIALSQFKHKSFDPKTRTYKFTVKNKIGSKRINKNWEVYQYDKMIKDCIMEDGRIDFKKLNNDFWNREDGFFDGHWWQDPEKLAKATYVLKLEASAYGELNIVDMISQYQDGEHNPRLNTLQALANAPRESSYDISLIDAIVGNLYASGIHYDETKGTVTVKDIEALAEREKDIKFREIGNWLENGGGMLVDGILIIGGTAAIMKTINSVSEPITDTSSVSKSKYTIGKSPKIKSCKFSSGKKYSQVYKYWTESTEFNGTKVYQRNDLIDLNLVDARGRTNLQRIEKGLAPIGSDGNPINLHHLTQKNTSSIAEILQNFHQKNTKIIHINSNQVPSAIDRNAFANWKRNYWKSRSDGFK